MPRVNGDMQLLPSTPGVPDQPIKSAPYNAQNDDWVNDANSPRPTKHGGTGANNNDDAAKNLGLVSAKDLAGVNTVAGTANAIAITTDRVYTTYTTALYLAFRAASNIAAGGTTINVDGVGAKPLYKTVAAGLVPVNAGDIIAKGYYRITYDPAANSGAGAFILLNPGNASSAYQVGDFLDTAHTLNSDWLRRDGGIYPKSSYPELGDILPPLPDGVTWSNLSLGAGSGTVTEIISTSSGFMLCFDDGTNTKIYASSDGDTWSLNATISNFRASSIVRGGSTYVAVDAAAGKVSSSNDGVTWSSPLTVAANLVLQGVAYGAGVFLACGSIVSGGSQCAVIYSSTDGVAWTQRRLESSSIAYYFKVRFLNGVFIAVGSSGAIATSTDGTTWTARTSGVSSFLQDVAYGAGLYVVVGPANVILTSANLSSWTSRSSGTSQQLNGIAYSTSGFLAVGTNGTARISTDGITWTGSATGNSSTLYTAKADPNAPHKYYVGGSGATLMRGVRTLPTQFQVPNDDPTYGWIKAVS